MESKYRVLIATNNLYFTLGVEHCIEQKYPYLDFTIDTLEPGLLYSMESSAEFEEYNLLIFDIAHLSIRKKLRPTQNILYSVGLSKKELCGMIHQTIYTKIKFDKKLPVLPSLSKKETEYFKLMTKGTPERTICRLMNISSKTISTHRRNVRIKMGLQNRNQFLQFISRMTSKANNRQSSVIVT